MKKFVGIILVLLVAACTPSETAIETAIAQTQEAAPTFTLLPPTKTAVPTNSPMPTLTQTSVPTETPEPLPIAGSWKGKTSSTIGGNPGSERIVTVSIPIDCQIGDTCGYSSVEDACNYEMTLKEVQGDVYIFDVSTATGESFCLGNTSNQYIELTIMSNNQITYYYRVTRDDGSVVIRKGVLILLQ